MARPARDDNSKDINSWPTFGRALRGARLGFHWVGQLHAYMRVDSEGPPYRVDIVPAVELLRYTRKAIGSNEHVCFWECKDGMEAFLDSIPRLKGVKRIKRPITLWLNEDGE